MENHITYDQSIDRPHRPTKDDKWQESDCYWFYDAASGVGGFNRLGQTPNLGKGQLQLFLFKVGQKRFSLQHEDIPGDQCERSAFGQRVGNATTESLEDGRVQWTWDEVDCAGELEFYESFYPPRDWMKKSDNAAFSDTMNDGGHLECSGRVRGKVRIDNETFEIDGLAHRDRSWGVRKHAIVRQHRMFSGTVGPNLSFASAIMQFKGGETVKLGFIIKDGIEYDIEDLEILSHVSFDTFTVKGGTARMRYDGDQTIEITATSVHGFVTNMFGLTFTDHIATIECDGQSGFCDIEASFLQGEKQMPPGAGEVHLICNELGLSDFEHFEN